MLKLFKFSLLVPIFLFHNIGHALCPQWGSQEVGQLDKAIMGEASGVTASSMQKGAFIWTNDSSNGPELFATGLNGQVRKRVRLLGFRNIDTEALALGPCPSSEADSCIYVGDIGDGIGWRPTFKVGVFRERDFWTNSHIQPEKVINFRYPAGQSHDAEGMIVTPDKHAIIFTKSDEGIGQIFSLNIVTNRFSQLGELNLNGILSGSGGKGPRVTDASLSRDAQWVLLLTYSDIVEANVKVLLRGIPAGQWRRGIDYSVIEGPNLPQQETITYAFDGSFILSSESPEGRAPAVINYVCRN